MSDVEYKDIKSSWESTKSQSSYHFDNNKFDHRYDCIFPIGRFVGDWRDEVEWVIENSKPSSWRTRVYGGKTSRGDGGKNTPPDNWIDAEEYDIIKAGGDPNITLCRMGHELPPKLQKMCDMIGLENGHDKAHAQMTGEVFTKHIDKLGRIYPEDPDKIMRIVIMLTDWEPGHFYQYGNYTYQGWRAGDIHYFDWKNVPHCTANAGLAPRATIVTTGIRGPKTEEFLKLARSVDAIEI